MPFTLKKDGTEFLLDSNGLVTSGGKASGKWTVTADNAIRISPGAPSPAVDIPVGWSFVDNQLWLVADGARLHSFHKEGMPDYTIVANKLQIRPSVSAVPSFTFTLSCEYSLDDDLNLKVKIGSTETKIVGTLENTRAQFLYYFTDQALGKADTLLLVGEWKRDDSVEGDLRMNFLYKTGTVQRTISIPRSFEVNPASNSLRLRYCKMGKDRFLELNADMTFKGGSQVIFNISKSGSTGTSTLTIDFKLSGTGKTVKELEITILKRDLEGVGKTLTIGGRVSAGVSKGTLTLNFAYAKVTGAKEKTVTLAIDGTFKMEANGEIYFSYKREKGGKEMKIGARDIVLGKVTLDGDLAITDDGEKKAVRAFLGATW